MKFNLGYLVIAEHSTTKMTGNKIFNKLGIPLVFKHECKSSDMGVLLIHLP